MMTPAATPVIFETPASLAAGGRLRFWSWPIRARRYVTMARAPVLAPDEGAVPNGVHS